MKPQDLSDWATNLYEGGGDAHLADVLDDCATAWEEDRKWATGLERDAHLVAADALHAFANKFTPAGKLGDMIDGEWNEYSSADEIVDEAFDEANRLRREAEAES